MTRIALLLLVAFIVAGCTAGGSNGSLPATDDAPTSTASSTASHVPAGECRTDYPALLLPPWARTGFSSPKPSVPYVLGDNGDMAAIVWATHHPLAAPPAAGKNNKILWVARVGAAEGPLQIRAVLEGTGQTVSRTVEPAPGPSIIDLPSPGCWSFDLTW